MISTQTSVRRAKTRRERLRGRRWVAAQEFPGGRKVVLLRSRTKPPALNRARLQTVQVVNNAANAGAITITPGAIRGGTLPAWKRSQLGLDDDPIVE